jgi:hypothetical protein
VRPTQLDGANAVGLAYTRIQPGVVRRVCLVDTGMTPNADTRRVVARLPSDSDADDVDRWHRHGTSMAMHMGGELNGVGMVGVWPLGELVSYRAVRDGSSAASFEAYYLAIRACTEQDGVAVIALSLREPPAGSGDHEALVKDAVTLARANGINLVAAAGNGGSVAPPASFDGVFAVAAGALDGGYCAFASRGPEIDLLAPGCGLAEASPFTLMSQIGEGSSQAAAMTAQVIAALRSYEPSLSADGAENALRLSTDQLDVERAFRARGLGFVIDDGLAAAPPRLGPDETERIGRRLSRPRLHSFRVHRRCSIQREFGRRCTSSRRRYVETGRRIRMRLRTLPARAATEVRVDSGRGELVRSHTFVRRSSQIEVPVPRDWRKVRLRFVPAHGARTLPSPPVFVSRR